MARTLLLTVGFLLLITYPLVAVPQSGSAQGLWLFAVWLLAAVARSAGGGDG